MHLSNLLIVMEDISVDVNLRNEVLENLHNSLGSSFFENEPEQNAYNEIREYSGKIVRPDGKEYENFFDSLMPKRVGNVPELLVYAYLIRKNYGYVVPLLQAQRILGKKEFITPSDFLLLRSKGEVFGLEVGTKKESQIASFSTITSMPVFTVGIGDQRQPQPFRCGKCQRWIIYCDKVIDACATNNDGDKQFLDCSQCSEYNDSQCDYIVCHGRAYDHANRIKTLRYHYNCVRDDSEVSLFLRRARTPKLIAPIPWVSGLSRISTE
jgi:hypothetical protein